jgi:hypothetical protein
VNSDLAPGDLRHALHATLTPVAAWSLVEGRCPLGHGHLDRIDASASTASPLTSHGHDREPLETCMPCFLAHDVRGTQARTGRLLEGHRYEVRALGWCGACSLGWQVADGEVRRYVLVGPEWAEPMRADPLPPMPRPTPNP